MTYDLGWLLNVFAEIPGVTFVQWRDHALPYSWLLKSIDSWRGRIADAGVKAGAVVALEADFSPSAIALFLALVEHNCIIVPLTPSVERQKSEFRRIAQVEWAVQFADEDCGVIEEFSHVVDNPHLLQVRQRNVPGLVLFSSGSTGKSKGAVHDLSLLLEKFKVRRTAFTAITFLMMDHIGGINTLLAALSNGGTIVPTQSRTPTDICRLIERYAVDLLPTSPTFLNLLIISETWKHFDLSSLKRITYGTEIMPEPTLRRLREVFPAAQFHQTYGLSELGILRSKSKSSDSVWFRVGGAGYETMVKNGTLWIRAKSAMLGYLNAASPFDEEGWYDTGDCVETDGDFIHILGRNSEVINVGGEKVYPAEVESVLMSITNVKDVAVTGIPNPITGSVVGARFNLVQPEDHTIFRNRVRTYTRERLPSYKVPVKIEVVDTEVHSERFKKMRRAQS
jgi:acyl-coenzyme A synthetase/AMP-(fatty) acid ligase